MLDKNPDGVTIAMLPYALAIIVGLSSSVLFVTAFFLPDIHRQDDFFWSGIGLFYALVLWFCATSITGAVLLGQLAVVALLTAYFWQVFKLRKAIANPATQENLDSFSVVGFFSNLVKRPSSKTPGVKTTKSKPLTRTTTNQPSDAVKEQQLEEPKTQSITPTSQVTSSTPVEEQETPLKTTAKVSEENKQQESSETAEVKNIANSDLAKTSSAEDTTPEKIEPPAIEIAKPEIAEITVEKVTIVEEETNWDDEVEDIPISSVKVIKEEATLTQENSPTIENPSQEKPSNPEAKSTDSPESSS